MALLSSGASYTYATGFSPNVSPNGAYPDTGLLEATDGSVGNVQSDAANFGFLSAAYNPPTGGCNITIDLGDTYTLDYVRFYFYSDAGGIKAPNTLTVKGSTDGDSFDSIGSFSLGAGDWNGASGARWSNNLSVSGDYRYVQFVTVNAGDWCFFSEFEVYGTAVGTPAPANVRIGERKGVEIN
jgi:hypothetical protein